MDGQYNSSDPSIRKWIILIQLKLEYQSMEPFFLNHFRQFGTSYLSRICCGLFLHNYVKNWATLYSNIWSRCYSPTWYCSRSKRKARIKVGCPKSIVFVCQAFESGKRLGVWERERERERERSELGTFWLALHIKNFDDNLSPGRQRNTNQVPHLHD